MGITKRNGPAANGAEGSAVLNEGAVVLAQNSAEGNRPAITRLTLGPGGKAEWLVTVAGVCVDPPMRDRRLRNFRRFGNVMKHRFGVEFATMPQSTWDAIVGAAIGGASS